MGSNKDQFKINENPDFKFEKQNKKQDIVN